MCVSARKQIREKRRKIEKTKMYAKEKNPNRKAD